MSAFRKAFAGFLSDPVTSGQALVRGPVNFDSSPARPITMSAGLCALDSLKPPPDCLSSSPGSRSSAEG
ncbi:hypothetical protein CTAM01_00054 [Colletotrichum tamarilloi]|uniref:Uncharacterized protein n=1 Tax=Colletotrichum tamarilloi TaxID=1209934 RepID=A0ABQ9RU52_9PEZI|nr:uncharacterized protein CTAM01_00054 [Colletotrichum tamarilloi]KAK1512659.1 hypothetical protein CTAM01_00054 [Colletotrichum tamarilloi]